MDRRGGPALPNNARLDNVGLELGHDDAGFGERDGAGFDERDVHQPRRGPHPPEVVQPALVGDRDRGVEGGVGSAEHQEGQVGDDPQFVGQRHRGARGRDADGSGGGGGEHQTFGGAHVAAAGIYAVGGSAGAACSMSGSQGKKSANRNERYYGGITSRAKTKHYLDLDFDVDDTNLGLDVDGTGYIHFVDANSAAANASVKADTIIVNINDTDVVTTMDVRTLVEGLTEDDATIATITTVDATEVDRTICYTLESRMRTEKTFGLSFDGNCVTSVDPGSIAADAGIVVNTIIKKIGSTKVSETTDVVETLRRAAVQYRTVHVYATFPAITMAYFDHEDDDSEEDDGSEDDGDQAAQLRNALRTAVVSSSNPFGAVELQQFTTHEYNDVKHKLVKMDESIERNNSRVDEIADSNTNIALDVKRQLVAADLKIAEIKLATDGTKNIVSELKEKVDTAFGEYLREPTPSEMAAQTKDGKPTHSVPVFQTAISTLADVAAKMGKKLPFFQPGTDHAKHPLADALQAITITIQNLATKIDNIEKKSDWSYWDLAKLAGKAALAGGAATAVAGVAGGTVANVAKAAAGGVGGVGAGLLRHTYNALSGSQTAEQQLAQAKGESAAAEVELAKLRAATVQTQLAHARKAAARAADAQAQATPFVPDPATDPYALVVRNPINNSQGTSATVPIDFDNGVNGVPRTLQGGI